MRYLCVRVPKKQTPKLSVESPFSCPEECLKAAEWALLHSCLKGIISRKLRPKNVTGIA